MKIKRKAKSGQQKRLESKNKGLTVIATASGQKSLLEMFGRQQQNDDWRWRQNTRSFNVNTHVEEYVDDVDAANLGPSTETIDPKREEEEFERWRLIQQIDAAIRISAMTEIHRCANSKDDWEKCGVSAGVRCADCGMHQFYFFSCLNVQLDVRSQFFVLLFIDWYVCF